MSLTEFSESLKVGEYYAVYAAEDEQQLEGPFWLARITEPPTKTTCMLVRAHRTATFACTQAQTHPPAYDQPALSCAYATGLCFAMC